MAEVVGTVSAIVPLALQATIILYQTIQSLNSRARLIRGLGEELKDLQEALQNLQELLSNSDIDLTALKGPLERCASACNEFREAVIECTQHSSGERYSKRDWLKMQYMGGDISDFRNMLAGYKSTITIALAYANLRTTRVTESVFEEYKEHIKNTQNDLEEHLQDIRTRLETLLLNSSTRMHVDPAEFQRMEDEKQSTEKSLDICDRFLTLMIESRSSLLGTVESAPKQFYWRPPEVPMRSAFINAEGFNSTQKELVSWMLGLQKNLWEINKQMTITPSDNPLPRGRISAEQQTFQDEAKGTEDLLEFCRQAGQEASQRHTNFYEDITAGDDSHVTVVTKFNDLISAKHIKSGNRSKLVLGQMSDASIQSIFLNTLTSRAPANGKRHP
ncbi:hypothetical protein BJX63DRAFT_435257 [Aspergillus granulosus]|uniref:Azaphilone pigments biosynthesis cluster protein L N-terminal domain-containing protein n=1 Tax=Aspergillus granulosus TaxID=176169 RepID=A0ABR4H1R0_9EURO